jgi:hypothetical protein
MKKIMIRAALEPVSYEDVFKKNGHCIENKLFFLKHPISKEMYGYTKVYEGNENDPYFIKEIRTAFVLKIMYVLRPATYKSEFIFKLILQEAERDDFFESNIHLMNNVIFYVDTIKGVQGPFYTNHFTNDRINQGLEQGNLYIPSKRQTFEQILNQQTA